jgi:hypothetical protein
MTVNASHRRGERGLPKESSRQLAALAPGGTLGFMETGRTVLFAVQEGKIWRVQIAWPNGVLQLPSKAQPNG